MKDACVVSWDLQELWENEWLCWKRYHAISTHIDGYSYENDNMQFLFPFEEQTKWLNVYLIISNLCKSS